ncbi:MAG: GNAT family N-acetyltransferase [Alphaproteobacteria bacterium]|nr:GNAT family N-acetyltransferase [Alphaproteobacteria bacterium]
MAAPPKTVLDASAAEEKAIREAVRNADPATLGTGRVLATEAHAGAAFDLLADPAVSEPIYALPKPLTLASVKAWIADAEAARERGEGLLILTMVESGPVMGYAKITVWPDRASAELGGALRTSLQGGGAGGAGAAHTIAWIFKTLKVRLICLTAATDNIRSAKLIDRMGFKRKGERDALRPDGTTRRSIYWELTRDEWEDASPR